MIHQVHTVLALQLEDRETCIFPGCANRLVRRNQSECLAPPLFKAAPNWYKLGSSALLLNLAAGLARGT